MDVFVDFRVSVEDICGESTLCIQMKTRRLGCCWSRHYYTYMLCERYIERDPKRIATDKDKVNIYLVHRRPYRMEHCLHATLKHRAFQALIYVNRNYSTKGEKAQTVSRSASRLYIYLEVTHLCAHFSSAISCSLIFLFDSSHFSFLRSYPHFFVWNARFKRHVVHK